MDDKSKGNRNQIEGLEIGLGHTKSKPIAQPMAQPQNDSDEADLQPQSLQFRIHSKQRRSRSYVGFLTVLGIMASIFVVFASFRYVPAVRVATIKQLKTMIEYTKNEDLKEITPVLVRLSKMVKGTRAAKIELAAMPMADVRDTCSNYIKSSLDKKLKTALTDSEFAHLLNCELFHDSPRFVVQSLDRRKVSFIKDTSWEDMTLGMLALEATRRLNPFSPQSNFSKGGCLRWSPTSDCLMRYVDESRAQFKSRWSDGQIVLQAEVAKQNPDVQAWFQLSNSLYAMKDQDFVKAQTYLDAAAVFIKNDPNPYLEREIYRNAVMNAFVAKNAALAAKARALRPEPRIMEDPRAFLDVELILSLSSKDPLLAKDALESYLSQSESAQRFVSDPRFLTILLTQTQLIGLEARGLFFAEALFGKRDMLSTEAYSEALVMLYARMYIGAGKTVEATELLDRLERSNYKSAELYHLKGVAQLLTFKRSDMKLSAAKAFQTAGSMTKNEETLFAMLVALLDVKDLSKAEQTLKQWDSLGASSKKTMWYGFAKGLMSYYGGDKVQAKALWDANEQAFPAHPMWPKLKANLSEDVGYLETELVKRLSLMLSNQSPIGSLALFGQKS